MSSSLKMNLPLLQKQLELDQVDWQEQDVLMYSNTDLSMVDAWIAQKAWWDQRMLETVFQALLLEPEEQDSAVQRKSTQSVVTIASIAQSTWNHLQMVRDALLTKCMPSMNSIQIVDKTKSHNQEVPASIIAATLDREFFQTENANTVQLSL